MTWLDELRKRVEQSSLVEVATALGISKSTISLVLNGKYPASTDKIQTLVESVFMGHTVVCPILGEIPKHKCASIQAAKHASGGPHAIRLWKACRSGCANSDLKEGLKIPVRLEQPAPPKRERSEKETVRTYDAQAAIARLERQARTDSEERMGGNFQRLFIELLQREIIALGSRYNRAIKQ
ncbi:helix-turn-helix domain-containing protein [Vibrio mimicus]|uniref:XRE family transcriptional regulator n=1 Tax=Vibrio mimicus TaxID=674 RepID=A0A2J9VKH9_VIBMI|nr:helix-turn-helix transcriptional regulator [Vibrio mimicus]EEW12338.1 hypothetical protein VMD_03550 [Vibrio mimicus VM573]KFE33087.1 helix-turn-helix family protein [Vibrio mimicus]PNM64283.1 XRE family transcriptional regulator [Vibrio mimicus]